MGETLGGGGAEIKNIEQKEGKSSYVYFASCLKSSVLVLRTSLKVFGTSLFLIQPKKNGTRNSGTFEPE